MMTVIEHSPMADTTDHFERFEVVEITDEEREAIEEYRRIIGRLNAELVECGHDAARREFARRRDKFFDNPTTDEAFEFLRDTAASKAQIIEQFRVRSDTLKEAHRRTRLKYAPVVAAIFKRVKAELDEYLADYESDLRERYRSYKLPFEPDILARGLKARSDWLGKMIEDIERGFAADLENAFKGVINLNPTED